MSGRIATSAANHALPSRQYGLQVKCGPAGMGQKVGGAVPLCLEGSWVPIAWAEPYLRTKWHADPSILHGPKSEQAYFQLPKILGRPQPPNNKCYRQWPLWPKNFILEVGDEQQKFCAIGQNTCILAYHLVYQFSP